MSERVVHYNCPQSNEDALQNDESRLWNAQTGLAGAASVCEVQD